MVLAFEVLLIAVLFITLLYGIKYILLIGVKYNADRAFEKLCRTLTELYNKFNTLFSGLNLQTQEDIAAAQETQKFITQALMFTIQKDGNERIIAYANSIINNMQTLIDSSERIDADNINVKRYKGLLCDYENVKNYYNNAAKNLKHYADVFPTSLFARLKKIKTMDYLN